MSKHVSIHSFILKTHNAAALGHKWQWRLFVVQFIHHYRHFMKFGAYICSSEMPRFAVEMPVECLSDNRGPHVNWWTIPVNL